MCSATRVVVGKGFEEKIHALEKHVELNMDKIRKLPAPHSLAIGQDVFAEYEGSFYR